MTMSRLSLGGKKERESKLGNNHKTKAVLLSAVLALSTSYPAAVAQDSGWQFEDPVIGFSQSDPLEQAGLDRVEARAMVSLRIPFGGPARTYEANKPRLSLNMGLADRVEWQSFGGTRNYSNMLEFGSTFDGHQYLNAGNQSIDYNSIIWADENGKKDNTGRNIGIGVLVVGGVLAAGLLAGIIVIATDSDDGEG